MPSKPPITGDLQPVELRKRLPGNSIVLVNGIVISQKFDSVGYGHYGENAPFRFYLDDQIVLTVLENHLACYGLAPAVVIRSPGVTQ